MSESTKQVRERISSEIAGVSQQHGESVPRARGAIAFGWAPHIGGIGEVKARVTGAEFGEFVPLGQVNG